ncbi:SPT3 Dosage dependent suppressor of Ty-induced promoter mutations-like protein [Mortierella claussenii]|nr:SPT3 Dosage dependent suppressor of Ty-induced promoter mutations-like protein [Mortierella claussenii]
MGRESNTIPHNNANQFSSAFQQQRVLENQHTSTASQHTLQQHALSSIPCQSHAIQLPTQTLQPKQTMSFKQKPASHYGQRYNPMYPSPAPSSTTPVLPNASLNPAASTNTLSHTSTFTSHSAAQPDPLTLAAATSTSLTAATVAARSSLTPQMSPRLTGARPINENLMPSWSPARPSSSSPSSIASMPTYLDHYERTAYSSAKVSNLLAKKAGVSFAEGFNVYVFVLAGTLSKLPLLGAPLNLAPANSYPFSSTQLHAQLPAFDVKAYTFRKKTRHYVAVKHKNALRIEPIIYLKTSILDEHRQVVRNWDYLRFNLDRFRDNAQPKKKLSPEEMRGSRILDVDITLVSPNNKDRVIEDSCPACVMRMDGERKIMQVLPKNFKQSPMGEPLIDIRKGHAIVCIKLNCYCDHHNEHEGFVVRIQTLPEVVRMGGSVKLRICCEARSKTGPGDQDAEEEDGLTDIDAPVSTGSRSPAIGSNEQMLQSPSLSHTSSNSSSVKGHQRTSSTNSAAMASPRSMDERVVNSLAVERHIGGARGINDAVIGGGRVIAPPKFRQIYPLTPSEGTILGGTRVTIHGAHFDVLQNPVVYFGKVPAELVTISHHDVMECTTPPAENLKPGIVPVQIASLAFPLSAMTDKVDFMYMAPPDYDLCNLAATSLSYAMANEYPQDNSLAYLLGAHGNGAGIGLSLLDDNTTFAGNDFDIGFAFALSAKEEMVLDFLRTIQVLAPGRVLPSFRNDAGHTLLHLAAQAGMSRLVRELLDMGIDHTAMDRNNKTALHFARMVHEEEIVQMLAQAKVPPRPMVPRTVATEKEGSGLTRQQTVSALIRKYEEDLVKIVKQELYRKHHSVQELKARAEHIMELKDQAARNSAAFSVVGHNTASVSESALSIEYERTLRRASLEDTEEEDIMMDDMSNPSSPEGGRYGDDWEDDVNGQEESEQERKRRAKEIPQGAQDQARKVIKEEPSSLSSVVHAVASVTDISPAQQAHIETGVSLWERTRSAGLFGQTAELSRKTGLHSWICDHLSISALNDSRDKLTLGTAEDNILHIMALTGTGLHHYSERQGSTSGITSRSLEHWTLLEIEAVSMAENDWGTCTVDIEMCGLVPRGGRNPLGEHVVIELPKDCAHNFSLALARAHSGLMRQLNLQPKLASTSSLLEQEQPSIVIEKTERWVDATLGLWGRLFHIDERALESIDYTIRYGTFTLKPVQNSRNPHSLHAMGAIMRTLREFDQCSKIRFEGVQVLDDGWRRPELIKELERMTREMRQIDRWNFAGCGWSSDTMRGFLAGLKATGPQAHIDQDREPCRRISLARNDFGGEDAVGHLLAACLAEWRQFKTLDLTDCNIGLAGMEALVGQLQHMFTIRLHGNQFDHRWWQWVDTLLIKNQGLQKCRLGAPRLSSALKDSLISEQRLCNLQDLTHLDLSTAPINPSTISVLCSFASTRPDLLALTLNRCHLEWTDLVPLFKTICAVNQTTKFTLDVSQNALFDSEAAVQSWVDSIMEVGTRSEGKPFGIKMQELIVRDAVMRRILEPLESATCFNEFNVKGLRIKRENQVKELEGLSYDDAITRIKPEDASSETCLVLGRVLASNKTLVMLDISGTEMEQVFQETLSSDTDASTTAGVGADSDQTRNKSAVAGGRGFGRRVALVFPALASNDTLRILSMDHNRFGEEGMESLAEALKSNTGLGVLSCDGNDAYTHKALKAIEKILPPFDLTSGLTRSVVAPCRTKTFQGTMEEAQAAGYNSTLSVWTLKSEEILMHKDLLSVEVERLLAEYHRIETMQARNREQEAKFGPPGDTGRIVSGESLLADAKGRYESAVRNRAEYLDTYSRIVGAIDENNRRSKEVYERKKLMEQQAF